MTDIQRQATLKTSATMLGRGLHTGKDSSITIHPADPNSGVVFVTERGQIPASAKYVHDTRRGTNLANGDAEINTVEHLLSALAGSGVDNARIETTGPEIPIGDGSALPFVELIESAGIVLQSENARIIHLPHPVWIAVGDKYLLAVPADNFRVSAFIAFTHPMIGEQAVSFDIDPAVYKREVAPARTFCTSVEIDMILSQGLGQGGSMDNVVVAYDDSYSVPLRFSDEFVRHKVLDLIGDLSLIGGRLCADITAIKSSHTLNTSLADKILRIF